MLLLIGSLCCWIMEVMAVITWNFTGKNLKKKNHPRQGNPLKIYMPTCSSTHWGRVTHICISKLSKISSDNGLSPGRCQAIIWTNAGILLIEPLKTNSNVILIKINAFSFTKILLKMSSGNWRSICLGLNGLTQDFGWGQFGWRPCVTASSTLEREHV